VLAVYREARERGWFRLRASLAVSPTWDGAVEAATALRDLASWAGGRGIGDDRLRVAGICLHYGGDASVARILHEAQPYTGWAGFVESANSREAYTRAGHARARLGLRVNTLVTRCLPEVLDVLGGRSTLNIRSATRAGSSFISTPPRPTSSSASGALGLVATTNPISYLYRSAGDEVRGSVAPPTSFCPI
jgi:hypothetical protein